MSSSQKNHTQSRPVKAGKIAVLRFSRIAGSESRVTSVSLLLALSGDNSTSIVA